MAEKITDKLVNALLPPPKGNRITYDTDVKGLGLRITAAGARSFILNYRINGRERRYTIGAYPDWSVKAARDEAKALKRRIDLGHDPMGERHAEREAPTVADLCDRYVEEHLPKKRPLSQRDDRKMINRFVRPKLGRLKVANVRHADIDGLHRSLRSTPYQANRVIALLSKMFALAIKWDWRSDNPAKGIEKYSEEHRERYLSQDELARLTAALAEYPNQTAANAIRLLLLTGARKGEVLSATWGQFDLEAGVWTKPSAHTKQKKLHRVPLSAPAMLLLSGMKANAASDHVFTGRAPGEPLQDIKGAWETIRKAANIEDVRVHDLRHTYASILASAGLSLPIVGALLGHTQPATTARYAHLYDEPLRKATDTVGAIVTGQKPAEVVPLRKDGVA